MWRVWPIIIEPARISVNWQRLGCCINVYGAYDTRIWYMRSDWNGWRSKRRLVQPVGLRVPFRAKVEGRWYTRPFSKATGLKAGRFPCRKDETQLWRQASGEKIYNGKRADKENGHLFVYSSNLELTGMLRKEKKESSWKRIKGNVKGLADNHRACPNIVNWQKLGKFDWISAW